MGLKLTLMFGCLAYVWCRTVTVQKTSPSLTEESQDTDDVRKILKMFLDYPDVIFDLKNADIESFSEGGNYCKKLLDHNACFDVKGIDPITIEVTLNGKDVMTKAVTVPNPPAVCKKSIPGVPMVKDICAQIKNDNLQISSGCVYIRFKLKDENVSARIGCYSVNKPRDDVENGNNEEALLMREDTVVESLDLQDSSLKFQPFSNNS